LLHNHRLMDRSIRRIAIVGKGLQLHNRRLLGLGLLLKDNRSLLWLLRRHHYRGFLWLLRVTACAEATHWSLLCLVARLLQAQRGLLLVGWLLAPSSLYHHTLLLLLRLHN